MASCVAVLSSANAPLFVLSSDASGGDGLADHYSLHTSLDVIEEKTPGPGGHQGTANKTGSGGTREQHGSRELYLGSLYTTEKKKVIVMRYG